VIVDAKTHALGHLGVALAFGLVIMVMIYAVGHVSGAHFDAAVTFAFAVTRHFPWRCAAEAAAIGGTIGLDALVGGPISSASMNPVRSLAPALVSGDLHALWLYLLAPVLGTSLGALAYQLVRSEAA
jgi:glycerol uptake facilitator-like aquaporin